MRAHAEYRLCCSPAEEMGQLCNSTVNGDSAAALRVTLFCNTSCQKLEMDHNKSIYLQQRKNVGDQIPVKTTFG